MMLPAVLAIVVVFSNLMVVEVDLATKMSVTVVKSLPAFRTAWLTFTLPLKIEASKPMSPDADVAMSKDITYC